MQSKGGRRRDGGPRAAGEWPRGPRRRRAKRIPVGPTGSEGGAAPQRLGIDGLDVSIAEAWSAEEPLSRVRLSRVHSN